MNGFNENEFLEICRRFGVSPKVENTTLYFENESYFNKMKNSILTDRRGEVVFCVIRPNGRIITVTCEEYPEGTFRIPTGGLGHREDILDAVHREVREELGLDAEVIKFAGVIKIKAVYNDEEVMFYSYLFILKEAGGRLLLDASDDEVSEVKEVDADGLEEAAVFLKNLKGKWSDWGSFRYVTTHAVYRILSNLEEEA